MASKRSTIKVVVAAVLMAILMVLALMAGAIALLVWSQQEHCREHPVECSE